MIATNTFSARQVKPDALPASQPASANEDIAVLVQLIKSKNERGFHLLYDKYSGALYSVLIKIVRRSDVAEDLLQEVFLKIWKHIDGYDTAKGTLFTWMLNITRNQGIDYLRSSGYQQQLLNVNLELFSLHLDNHGARVSNTSELEFKDIKNKALQLEPKYAAVIDMIFFHGWTYEQTAQILDLPLGTVKTRARKALSMLKIIYQE